MSESTTTTNFSDFEDPLSNYEPAEYCDELHRAMAEETVSEMESQPCAEVPSDLSVREAMELLRRLDVSSLLVVDHGKLVGIFTERDVLESVAERYPRVADAPVSQFMTSKPVVVYECDPVGAALAAIAIGGYRHVPVLSINDRILGIASPKRFFQFLETRFGDATT